MKRSLIFCAIALVAITAHTASADVNVQLNLRYNDPADESAGGSWDLLAGTDNASGIAGISVLIDGISGVGATGASGYEVFETQTVGSVVEIVTGSDMVAPLDAVGAAGFAGNVADDLFAGNSPAIWASNTLLASGTFGATRPAFLTTSGTLAAGANEISGTAAVAATLNTSVRGDSVATDGLTLGDANRDGTTNGLDFSILSSNFNTAGTDWDLGNFNSDAAGTNGLDFSILSSNFNATATPPAISAVPEPTSLVLLSLGLCGLAARRRS